MKKIIKSDDFQIIQKNELSWHGTLKSHLVCEFEYFKDEDGLYWINNITTFEPYNKKGFGTRMINAAMLVYKEIYVSTAEKYEIKSKGIKGDLRYTNALSFDESGLKLFADNLIIKGILKKEWICHPFKK